MSNQEPKVTMPYTGHTPEELNNTLRSINECALPIEVFDAFLSEYRKTGSLSEARFFAMCEWDC